jgi:hypothetical protein
MADGKNASVMAAGARKVEIATSLAGLTLPAASEMGFSFADPKMGFL